MNPFPLLATHQLLENSWPVVRSVSSCPCWSTFYLASVSRGSCTMWSRETPPPSTVNSTVLDRSPFVTPHLLKKVVLGNKREWGSCWILWWVWTHRSEGEGAPSSQSPGAHSQVSIPPLQKPSPPNQSHSIYFRVTRNLRYWLFQKLLPPKKIFFLLVTAGVRISERPRRVLVTQGVPWIQRAAGMHLGSLFMCRMVF